MNEMIGYDINWWNEWMKWIEEINAWYKQMKWMDETNNKHEWLEWMKWMKNWWWFNDVVKLTTLMQNLSF